MFVTEPYICYQAKEQVQNMFCQTAGCTSSVTKLAKTTKPIYMYTHTHIKQQQKTILNSYHLVLEQFIALSQHRMLLFLRNDSLFRENVFLPMLDECDTPQKQQHMHD